ncbi:MAG: hypothetical protein ACXWK0_17425 [Caulobacteraceae bacterium]
MSQQGSGADAVSPLDARMYGAAYLDDDLLETDPLKGYLLRDVTPEGQRPRSLARVREALDELVARECARRLARLGGTEPDLQVGP